jgi:ureidoglycolate lyase
MTMPDTASDFTTRGPAPTVALDIHTRRSLPVKGPTPENFSSFGKILTPEGRTRLPVNTYGDKLDLYRESFETDQPIEWFIVEGRPRWNGVLFLERHLQLSQAFIPLGGRGFYLIVARPDAKESGGFVVLDEISAFFVPGDMAIQLHRGTWHENPIPAESRMDLLVTSHANLTLAHQQNPDPRLAGLPLDLERRWYKAGGYELILAA